MSKRLLIQSDDYGITPAVSTGIRKGIREGLIRNTGMFVNMSVSREAADEIREMDVCLGIDINYVCGKPVSKPEDVPDLVDDNGWFIPSGVMSKKSKITGMDELGLITDFEEDPYPYDEILLETENQVRRFIEMTGRKPEYMHPHSLMSRNCYKAAKETAQKYGIVHSLDVMRKYPLLPHTFDGMKGASLQDQLAFDSERNLLGRCLPGLGENETRIFICHAGYADYDLFRFTTLTLRRTKDLAAMLSEEIRQFVKQNNIELITYRDLQ